MDWRPALRPDLVRLPPDPERGEGEALFDPVLNRRVNLGPLSRAMVPLLDGTHGLGEVLATAGRWSPLGGGEPDAGAADAGAAEVAFRSLLLMNLVDGSGAAVIARARAVQAGDLSLDPVLLPGTSFGCQGSGDCCKSYVFGPLTDEDVARLEALPIEAHYPYLGPGPYVDIRPLRDGSQRPFLRTFGQQCIFQLPDERCGIHAAFGEAEKPGLCRLYPYQHVPTIFGRKIYDRGECATFAKSARCGTPLEEAVGQLLPLLPGRFEIYHPLVRLGPELPCDYGHFYRLQEALCQAFGEQDRRGAAGRLRLAAAWLGRFTEALGRCPLGPGEPDRTVDEIVARAPEQPAAPAAAPGPAPSAAQAAQAPDQAAQAAASGPAAGLLMLAALCGDLRAELLPHRFVIERARSQRRAHAQLLDLDEALGALQAVASARALSAERGEGRPTDRRDADDDAIPERWRAAADLRPDPLAAAPVEAALRLSLRSQLFSDRALVEERPGAGLVRAALIQIIALVRARLAAAARGAARPGLADFNAGHALAVRILNQEIVTRPFVQHDAGALAIVEAVAALLPPTT